MAKRSFRVFTAWHDRPRDKAELQFLHNRIRAAFYDGGKDTSEIAAETGYHESVIVRALSAVREDRRRRA